MEKEKAMVMEEIRLKAMEVIHFRKHFNSSEISKWPKYNYIWFRFDPCRRQSEVMEFVKECVRLLFDARPECKVICVQEVKDNPNYLIFTKEGIDKKIKIPEKRLGQMESFLEPIIECFGESAFGITNEQFDVAFEKISVVYAKLCADDLEKQLSGIKNDISQKSKLYRTLKVELEDLERKITIITAP